MTTRLSNLLIVGILLSACGSDTPNDPGAPDALDAGASADTAAADAGPDTAAPDAADATPDTIGEDAGSCDLECPPLPVAQCVGELRFDSGVAQRCATVDGTPICEPEPEAAEDCTAIDAVCEQGACMRRFSAVAGDLGFPVDATYIYALDLDGGTWRGVLDARQVVPLTLSRLSGVPADAAFPPQVYAQDAVWLTATNTLWAVGLDAAIGIGDDATTAWVAPTPLAVPPRVGTIRQVVMARDFLAVVNTSDELFLQGALNSLRFSWEEPFATGVRRAFAGALHLVVERTDDTFEFMGDWGWSGVFAPELQPWAYTGTIREFDWVWDYGCMLDGAGAPYCMERNAGAFGNPDDLDTASVVPVAIPTGVSGFDAIATLASGVCALDREAPTELVCWGQMVSDGVDRTVAPRVFPLPAGVSLDTITGAKNAAVALDATGRIRTLQVTTGILRDVVAAVAEPAE